MIRSFSALLLGTCILFSCSDSHTTMIDQLEIYPMVNPEVGVLIKSGNMTAMLTDEHTITGISSGLVFRTGDLFQSFQTSQPYDETLPVSSIGYLDTDAVVCYKLPDFFSEQIVIYRSTDAGASWEKTTFPNMNLKARQITFVNDNEGLIVVTEYNDFTGKTSTLIYQVDLDQAEVKEIGRITNWYPSTLKMRNADEGYILLLDQGDTYISRTTDGGSTWGIPAKICEDERLEHIEILDPEKLIAHGNLGVYHSEDHGLHWGKSSMTNASSMFFYDMSFVDTSIGYANDRIGLYKTTDGGKTWRYFGGIQPPNFHWNTATAVHFYNESTGIAYSGSEMSFTEDGGQTWKLIIYPFSYVTGD